MRHAIQLPKKFRIPPQWTYFLEWSVGILMLTLFLLLAGTFGFIIRTIFERCGG